MKRLMYLLLAVVLVVGFTAAGNSKAEAMDNNSAALLAGTVAVIGGAVMYAAALDAGRYRAVHVQSYPPVVYYREVYRPARTRAIYVSPGGHRDRSRQHDRWNDRGRPHDYRRH